MEKKIIGLRILSPLKVIGWRLEKIFYHPRKCSLLPESSSTIVPNATISR